MNQAILFNDDFIFDEKHEAWRFTAQVSGQLITVYCHSLKLKQLTEIDSCSKFDLEEMTEHWLESNEIEGDSIHVQLK